MGNKAGRSTTMWSYFLYFSSTTVETKIIRSILAHDLNYTAKIRLYAVRADTKLSARVPSYRPSTKHIPLRPLLHSIHHLPALFGIP